MQPVRIQVLEQEAPIILVWPKAPNPWDCTNTLKGFFSAQVLSSWASRTVLFVERTTDRGADYEYGEARQAGGQICGRCVAGQLLEYQPCVPPPKYSSTNQFFKTTSKSIRSFCLKTYISSAENETGLLKEVPVDCWETPFPNNSCQSEAACLCGTSWPLVAQTTCPPHTFQIDDIAQKH